MNGSRRKLIPTVPRLQRTTARRTRTGRPDVSRARAKHKIDWTVRSTVATAVVGALSVVGATVLGGLAITTTRDQVAAAHHQNRVAEQGQFTDRFTTAVDQLDKAGPAHLQARLGGIHALERLAHDSPRDQPTIVKTLAAFIRTTSQDTDPVRHAPVGADIQAALTALADLRLGVDGASIDLTGASLVGADLTEADLTGANLSDANLTMANLSRANLSGANLRRANLTAANMAEADLTEAYLAGASVVGSDLTQANLAGAILYRADLSHSKLNWANLSGANLNQAILSTTISGECVAAPPCP